MKLTKMALLQMLDEAGGDTTEYAFIEFGYEGILHELLDEGLVVRIPRAGDLDEVRITDKGRKAVRSESSASEIQPPVPRE